MSVRRDQHGRWFFRVTVQIPDGTKERISGWPGTPGPFQDLPRTQVGAREAERRAITAAMSGKPRAVAVKTATREAPETKTISEHSIVFLSSYKTGGKPAAKRERRYGVKFLLPIVGHLTIEELRQTDVDAFEAHERSRGVSTATINNRLSVLSSLIKYVTGGESKLRFKIPEDDVEIHAVDPTHVERLLAACNDDRYRAVILLASEAGLRVGEIRGLQHGDIKAGQLTVRRALDSHTNEVQSPKHGTVRTVPLSPRVTEVLASLPRRGLWVVTGDDGGAIGYWTLNRRIGAIYDRAKVARPEMLMHCLRHTFGTVMARRVPLGVLQQLMGHADLETTIRYVDISEDDKREAIAVVFGRGSHVAADSLEAN